MCRRWPADLVVPGSSTALGRDVFDRKRDSTAHSHPLLTHRPDITEILLMRT